MMRADTHLAAVGIVCLSLAMAGCASLSPDGGMGNVRQLVAGELPIGPQKVDTAATAANVGAEVQGLLRGTLTADSAVHIAMLNNRSLQAEYNTLGVSEAEYFKASLPPSLGVTLSRAGGGGEVEIGLGVVAGLLDLITLPRRSAIAADDWMVAQMKAAQATLRLAIDTRAQFYRAVAARERVSLLNQVRDSAQAQSELARRLGETGALNQITQAREHALTGEIEVQLANARLQQQVERERLTRLLGLWGGDATYSLPASVPALPARATAMPTVEVQAVQRRFDVAIARVEVDGLGKALGLAESTQLLADVEVAGTARLVRTSEGTVRTGEVAVDLALNLFDVTGSKRRAAEQRYQRAVNLLLASAVNARSEAREAYQVYRGTYDIARLYEGQILPVRKTIEGESLLYYNGMLLDVPALIADTRARILSNVQAIEARRDFWIATTNLHAALVGVAGAVQAGGTSTTVAGAQADGAGH